MESIEDIIKKGLHKLDCDESIPRSFLDIAIWNLKKIAIDPSNIKYKIQVMNKDTLCEEMENCRVLNYLVIGHDCGRCIFQCYLIDDGEET